ncbi:MAG: HypC/HybG/HupF family hydrogenase formation chaperone [Peptococcaceae bacterium]|nr:HypC/HybG/HupF family hydrogenase formation chaperone [Peptococcaceae bacterium]
MCIGVPGMVIEINTDECWALVETLGVRNKAGIILIDEEINPGDYLMIHAGNAIGKISPEDALATLELWEEILDAG